MIREAAYVLLGECYRDRGEGEKAREMLGKAITLNAENKITKRAKTLLKNMHPGSSMREDKP